jgi:hypothetical protein
MREPAEALCPELAAGDLVVTEIRGTQMPEDEDGRWIELYNASGRALDLIGIRVQFVEPDGPPGRAFLVRRSLPAEPGSYTVLGLFDDATLPPHVDYGFQKDFIDKDHDKDHPPWKDRMALDVGSCGEVIDHLKVYELPAMGTHSFGGEPDAAMNDDDLRPFWCDDATPEGLRHPGTPGSPNRPCP